MIEKRANYLKTILLLDEIEYFHSNLCLDNPKLFFRKLKFNILTLYKVKELLLEVTKEFKDHSDFIILKKSITKELNFINHIRNKISGHFDNSLLQKAAQWEPTIFYDDNKNEEIKILMAYKTIFESSINSYLNKSGKHLIYYGEIDLNLPSDRTIFLETIYKVNDTVIKILKVIKLNLEKQHITFNASQIFSEAKKAGSTNFNLNSKNNLEGESKNLLEESFLKTLDFSNKNDIELLLSKLEEILK